MNNRQTNGNNLSVTVTDFVDNIPDGSRITTDSFESRHRAVLVATAALLPFIFVISRLTGVESVTGAQLQEMVDAFEVEDRATAAEGRPEGSERGNSEPARLATDGGDKGE